MAKLADLNDPVAVANAVSEVDRSGRRAFLERYGVGSSRAYFVEAEGQLIDPQPLLAAIWAQQFPTRAGLKLDDFFAGVDNAGQALERGGLRVVRQGQYHLESAVLLFGPRDRNEGDSTCNMD